MEFWQENTWIIYIRDTDLLQDYSSKIHTSTARHVHELDWTCDARLPRSGGIPNIYSKRSKKSPSAGFIPQSGITGLNDSGDSSGSLIKGIYKIYWNVQ